MHPSHTLLHSSVNRHNFNKFVCNFESINIIKFVRMHGMESKWFQCDGQKSLKRTEWLNGRKHHFKRNLQWSFVKCSWKFSIGKSNWWQEIRSADVIQFNLSTGECIKSVWRMCFQQNFHLLCEYSTHTDCKATKLWAWEAWSQWKMGIKCVKFVIRYQWSDEYVTVIFLRKLRWTNKLNVQCSIKVIT